MAAAEEILKGDKRSNVIHRERKKNKILKKNHYHFGLESRGVYQKKRKVLSHFL